MTYDITIIGAGPAGLTAAIYTGRAKMKTLVISEAIPGGQAMLTDEIENYPGFAGAVKGPELMATFHEQAKKLEIDFKEGSVSEVTKKDKTFFIKAGEEVFESQSIIVATGAAYKKLGVKGEEEFTGRGVSYCGVCDAPFFKNKDIALVGGGDTAIYEAGHLLKFVSKLHLVHRKDRLRATKIMQDRVLNDAKTTTHLENVVEEIYGTKTVEGMKLKNVKTGKEENVPCKGVFIFIGIQPNAGSFNGLVKTSERGFLLTDEKLETSQKGIFAAGDIREKTLRQISTAVGEGALAAVSAQMYVDELKGIAYK